MPLVEAPPPLEETPPISTRESQRGAFYGSQWLQQVLLVAAVAAHGYMTLCLLVWDG